MKQTKRNGFQVMAGLIGILKPLLGIMGIAVLMGCVGNLMATFITILGGYGMLSVLDMYQELSLNTILIFMLCCAAFRGVLRYAEQASNHYIAFKLLASIRHQVFAALRRLAPAKLEGANKGNLVSLITSDIELLEVFYAHTVSPIAIAVITSVVMCIFLGTKHVGFGMIAAATYLLVGVVIPVINGRAGEKTGRDYRNQFGNLNTDVLDNLYGQGEILQYQQQKKRLSQMNEQTRQLEEISWRLKRGENWQRIATDSTILTAGIAVAVLAGVLITNQSIDLAAGVTAVLAMMSSFGPTAALSALSNNLQHTLASGNRVLDLLEEQPVVSEITEGATIEDSFKNEKQDVMPMKGSISCQNIAFRYPGMDEQILKNFSAGFELDAIHGIHGKSGCGKSTLLKLLMRFFETQSGGIYYGDKNVNQIQTKSLRSHISYVTQDTFLFQDTIENNIRLADTTVSRKSVIAAAKKASIHEFIESLPQGYDTRLAELGDSVSGGERQRIGLARAFLQDSDVILLDEPTSNVDSLNEGMILKSLLQEKEGKTIILVSHRLSTMGIADDILEM